MIKSERLSYRLLSCEDKPALKEILSDSKVTAPAGYMPSRSDGEFDEFFSNLTKHNTAFGIYHNEVLIGYFHANKYKADGEFADKNCIGVGFVIGKAYHGLGFGKEMLTRMSEYLLTLYDACFGDAFSENEASKRTLESCGYRYVEDYTMFFDELNEEKTCRSYVLTK